MRELCYAIAPRGGILWPLRHIDAASGRQCTGFFAERTRYARGGGRQSARDSARERAGTTGRSSLPAL